MSLPVPRKLTARKRRSQRGSTLLPLTLFIMAILALVLASVMQIVKGTISSARSRIATTEAFNMADAGIDLGNTWLSLQPSPPDDTALHPLTNFFGTDGTIAAPFGDPGTKLVIRISGNSANAGPVQKRYLIESQATLADGTTATVRAYVRQVSFGKYAFFADNDGSGYWDYNNHFEGPFHSNDSDGNPSTFLWKPNNTANPIFTYSGDDAFSVSGDVRWWKNNTGNVSAPTSTADYNSIAVGGQQTITTGYKTNPQGNPILDSNGMKIPNSDKIPLPSTNYQQEYVALGLTPPNPCLTPPATLPDTIGVSVTSGGGIFVHGDNEMKLAVDNSGNQQIIVAQKDGDTQITTTVTINPATRETTKRTLKSIAGSTTSDVYTTTDGLPNGIVFSDGNITSLKGTIADNTLDNTGAIMHRSAMTIATDIAAGKDVILTDSLKYNTPRDLSKPQSQDSNFNQKAGILGLLSRKVQVKDGAGPNLEFDGSIFATDTFEAQNYNNPPASANATMLSIGGVIVKNSGIFAAGNSDGSIASGYNETYHYDSRLADYPPPYFPTTGNQYDVLSWQRVKGFIQQ